MKKIILSIITLALATLSSVAVAADGSYKGSVTTANASAVQQGYTLYINFDIVLQDVKVKRTQALTLTPSLVAGERSVVLPKIVIRGRNNLKSVNRKAVLSGTDDNTGAYEVIDGQESLNRTIEYQASIPFEGWLAGATLTLDSDDCGCGRSVENSKDQLCKVQIEEAIEPYKATYVTDYVEPKTEAVKNREVKSESRLDFAVGKTVIRPEFGNNQAELDKIEAMIREVDSDEAVTTQSVEIAGYASPEGSLELNKRLSEGRAKALQNYMVERTNIPAKLYGVTFGGEDWQTLRTMVERSDMKYGNEVVEIIDNYSIDNGREKRIMDLHGGEPYKYMLREMFPSLRRVVMTIDYSVRDFNIDEAKEVIKSNPKNLSMNEMYLVANTYPVGSKEFVEVFGTAVAIFPDDPTANLNAASAALSRGDTELAQNYLSRAEAMKSNSVYMNDMGVLEALKANYTQALEWFGKAASAGNSDAEANIKQVNAVRSNLKAIEEQQKRFGKTE